VAKEKSRPIRTWVVVLNFQGREHVSDCLESLAAQDEPPGGAKVLVVDNASDDGSPEIVETRFPEIEILHNPRNLGFAGGNNAGIRRAMAMEADYVALLNMDATVDRHWLAELVEVADLHPTAALVGARIYTADGRKVEFDGQQFDPVLTAGGYSDRSPSPDPHRAREVAYACGAGVLMRVAALEQIGLFDESFFAYHEDVELSVRAWLCGYRVLNATRSAVYHQVGGAGAGVPFRDFMGLRNVALTLLKLYDGNSWRAGAQSIVNLYFDEAVPGRLDSALAALFEAPRVLERRRLLKARSRRTYSELVRDLERRRDGEARR